MEVIVSAFLGSDLMVLEEMNFRQWFAVIVCLLMLAGLCAVVLLYAWNLWLKVMKLRDERRCSLRLDDLRIRQEEMKSEALNRFLRWFSS